jgi:hypothetical protein
VKRNTYRLRHFRLPLHATRFYTSHAVVSKSFFFSKALVLVAVASALFAGNPAIGIITASGHFTLERSRVWGNSTLFDGSVVETESASSELALQNGVKMQLGASSRARVWENHIALEKGVSQVTGPASYEVDAAGLKIHAAGERARLRVGLSNGVEVTALTGSARVTNRAGVLMASIPAGRSMIFAMQAAETGAVTRTGCLMYKDGHYILQDDNTQEVVELSGKDLAENAGNHVQVFGTAAAGKPAVSIATALINVTSIVMKSQGGCLSIASALGASTDAPTGTGKAVAVAGATAGAVTAGAVAAGGGLSTGAIVGIVAAVVGGGAAGGIALTTGKKSSTSP